MLLRTVLLEVLTHFHGRGLDARPIVCECFLASLGDALPVQGLHHFMPVISRELAPVTLAGADQALDMQEGEPAPILEVEGELAGQFVIDSCIPRGIRQSYEIRREVAVDFSLAESNL